MANEQLKLELSWQSKFNQLCYDVFYKNPEGKELLEHLELKYFRSPVAFPGQDSSWAYFNEGKNEMIRSFTNGIQCAMNESVNPKQHKRKI